jgi:thymidylate kinase
MADFIELSGTAGSGKTTLYRELSKRWDKKCNWVPAHHLLPKKTGDGNAFKNLLKRLRSFVAWHRSNLDSVQMIEAAERFTQENPELVALFWDNIYHKQRESLNGIDQRFDKANFLFSLIQKQQILTEHRTQRIPIVDEGPTKIIDVLSNTTIPWHLDKEEIERCLQLLPLPKAVIYLQTDADLTVRRILGRKHVIRAHKNLSEQQLKDFVVESHYRKRFVNDLLQARKTEILYLDSEASPSANAEKAIAFINTNATGGN